MHDELSERIISATPVRAGGGRRSAALNRGEGVGGRQKGRETQGGKKEREESVHYNGVDFSSAPMLEHSSELALVQSLYANSMRCPPSAPGISVRNEDLPMRYVGSAPHSNLG